MEWISVKDRLPELSDGFYDTPVLAYHTLYGVGIGIFWKLDCPGMIEEILEEMPDNKYLASVLFIKSKLDGNREPEMEDEIDILEKDVYYKNLGMVTHWMPFPIPPQD